MRKIIIISNVWLMALLLIISMTGCGTDVASSAADAAAAAGITEKVCTGAGCVDIGAEGDLAGGAGYVILASTLIAQATTTLNSVTGNMGLSPADPDTYLTGFALLGVGSDPFFTSAQVVGNVYTVNNLTGTTIADLGTAVLKIGAAYTDANGRAQSLGDATYLNRATGTLNAITLVPGVYIWSGASPNVTITGDITISGSASDVWIFKIEGTLNMDANKKIILAGGAQASHIFWVVTGATAVIQAGAEFKGIILGSPIADITFGNLAKINGRIFSQTAVSIDATTVTQP